MPVSPGGLNTSFDVLLAFSLDAEANKRVEAGISTMEQELKRIQTEAGKVGQELGKARLTWTQFVKEFMGPEMKAAMKEGLSHAEAHKVAIGKIAEAWKKYKAEGTVALRAVEKEEAKATDSAQSRVAELRAEAWALRAQANSIRSDVTERQIGMLRDLSGSIQSISTKALATGGAIIGGIFAEVQNYVSKAPEATRETRAWAAATQELGRARERVDQELIKTALPLLQQAARVANQAAGIVEKHPEITSLALKAGAILVGVGVIGTAVSKGIKLVADIGYLTTIPTQLAAARLQDTAADKQLAAAQIRLKEIGGGVPGGGAGAAGGIAGTALPIAGFVLANLGLSAGLAKQFDELDKVLISRFGGVGKTVTNILEGALLPIFPPLQSIRRITANLPDLGNMAKSLLGIGDASKEAGDAVSRAAGKIEESARGTAIVNAFSSWKEDDARLIREAAENRKNIIAEAEREIANITREYNSQRVSINRDFSARATQIRRDFEEQSTEAERQYQENRAQIVRDAADRLRQLEEDHQERVRKMRQESEERIEELAASRDALGIVKEQRRLAQAEAEENRSHRLEVARARRETEQRLAELDSQYAAERARRQAQFEQDIRDNEAQRAEELARAAEQYQQEIRQAREAQAQKLRELQEGLNAERLRRREVFLDQIRDLDAALLGEKELRRQKYQEMLADAEAFFNAYRAALPTASSIGTVGGTTGSPHLRDEGGYMSRGLYRVAWNGIPEYMLSGKTTQAAERAIGASLTDESLSRLFSRIGDMRSAVYNDNRRLEVPLSKDARRAYEEGAKTALAQILGVR